MKFTTIQAFQGEKKIFPIYLILCKEEQERKYLFDQVIETLKILNGKKKFSLTVLNKSSFNQAAFMEQISNFSIFKDSQWILLEEIDKFSNENIYFLHQQIQKLNPTTTLICSGSALSAATNFYKTIDKVGVIFHPIEEKPWEKKKILAEWLVQETISQGKKLSLQAAQKIVECVGTDRQLLKNEIEKSICLSGESKEITFEMFKQIGTFLPQQTLWQLGEEIFHRNYTYALNTLSTLLLEGVSPYPLVAHLRTQFVQAQEILTLNTQGGKENVQKQFPYLKGTLLQKKIDLLLSYGQEKVSDALIQIYDAELKLRSENLSTEILLERLLIDLMS